MFQANDRFRVKESGLSGTINAVSFNSIYQETEYYVTWDAFPEQGQVCYPTLQANSIWEKMADLQEALEVGSYTGADPGPVLANKDPDFLPPGQKVNPWFDPSVKKSCEHKWVETGFHRTIMVYKYCDIEQK